VFGEQPEKQEIEIGDYVQNKRIPDATGIVTDIDPNTLKATVNWDLPGHEDNIIITTAFLSSLRLIMKPAEC
jgi:hypothetical protein